MSVTIKDIAKQVGVSPSTVSRVINGTASIKEETKQKIYEAMKELDYHANSQARNLANGSTRAIGMVIDAEDENTFSNAFFNRSVFAIERVAQANGYNLIIANNRDHASERLILERQVDGIILPSSYETEKIASEICKDHFPYIILGEPVKNKEKRNWIDINNRLGGKQAAVHLIEQGYQRIAMVLENQDTLFIKNRIRGYQEGLKATAGDHYYEKIIMAGEDAGNAYSIIKELMGEVNCPDAFLCGNNQVAYHTLRALKEIGKKVPQEIGIITFDNYPIAEYMDPPLTIVDVDTFTLGEKAAENLISKIKRQEMGNQQTVIATKLIIRESTTRRKKDA